MRLLLIRHGETASNVDHLLDTDFPGAPLNQTGLTQAAALAQRLSQEPIRAVFSSDLTRAVQTAAPVAHRHRVVHDQLPGLREIYAGDDEMGADFTRYVAAITSWFGDEPQPIPNGDTHERFLERYDAAIAQAAAVDCAAVVSHGAAIRMWVSLRAHNINGDFMRQVTSPNTMVATLGGNPRQGWQLLDWEGLAP